MLSSNTDSYLPRAFLEGVTQHLQAGGCAAIKTLDDVTFVAVCYKRCTDMPNSLHALLTRREREIMDAIFALGNRASAEQIRARLTDTSAARPVQR